VWRAQRQRSAPSSPDRPFLVELASARPAHGHIDIASYDIDGLVDLALQTVLAPPAMASHGPSDRLSALPIETLGNGPLATGKWVPETRGPMRHFSDVVRLF